jgi:hypothetical protein
MRARNVGLLAAVIVLVPVVVACFMHPLFGGGATYSYSGTPENTPIAPWTPGANDSPAVTGFGGRRLDSGSDAASLDVGDQ